MKPRHAAALALVGWYLIIPPVFSPMGQHPRSFNDLSAPPNKWDIWAKFDSESECEKENDICGLKHPSASNSPVNILIRIRMAISSQYQKRGSLQNALRPTIRASREIKLSIGLGRKPAAGRVAEVNGYLTWRKDFRTAGVSMQP